MDDDKRREIAQLWTVAQMYYDLAIKEKSLVDPTELKMTIGEFAENCKEKSYLDKHKPLLYAVAHLTSGAVRLYPIEYRLESERWKVYQCIDNINNDEEKVKKELKDNVNSLIHFLLRHEVVHAEPENKKYKTMFDFFLTLRFETVFQAMANVRQFIRNELETKGFLPKT
jgi:flagellar biosynthesis regulator FlaF